MRKIKRPVSISKSNSGQDQHRRGAHGNNDIQTNDCRVLIIINETDTRETIATLLEALGYRVSAAKDGMAAMSYLATAGFDLVITDLNLASLNGYRLCIWLKQALPHIKVLIMTECDRIEATGQADGWIYKPFEIRQLLRVLEEIGLTTKINAAMKQLHRRA